MRILHLSSLYPPGMVGGAEKVAAMLAEGQAARGHVVQAVHLSRDGGAPRMQRQVRVTPLKSRNLLWIEDVQRHTRAVTTANKLLQAVNVWATADVERVLAAFRPDVVQTHSMVELPPLVWRAARRQGAAVVHTLHDYDLLCSRATLFRDGAPCAALHPACAAMKRWKSLFAEDLDAVVAVSRPVLDVHLAHGLFARLPPKSRRVIWNAAEPRPCGPQAKREGPFTFGFLGRLVPEKGVGVLLEACRRLPSAGWRLRIAGRAPGGAQNFEREAQGLPVEFVGFTEPRAFLDTVDVLVAPSLWAEPFGLTVVEAFAAGAPVIGSDRGAIGELAGSLGADWVVRAGDPEALAARMTAVLDAGRAMLPPPGAMRTILDAVSPERMVESYLDLYAAVAPGTQARERVEPSGSPQAHPAA